MSQSTSTVRAPAPTMVRARQMEVVDLPSLGSAEVTATTGGNCRPFSSVAARSPRNASAKAEAGWLIR